MGRPSRFPHVFDLGIRNLEWRFGVRVKEYPTARRDADELYRDPKGRAEDINAAFADPEVKAIVASIGGDDSVRILPHLDTDIAVANPKVFMGYSDTTCPLMAYAKAGLTVFNGPAVMAGLAQVRHLPGLEAHIRGILFDPTDSYDYVPFGYRAGEYPDWRRQPGDLVGPLTDEPASRWLQGEAPRRGLLTGGCIEVLDMLVGTPNWPTPDFFTDRILFIETSEEVPSPSQVGFWLRNYGAQGILERLAGLIVGRPRGYSAEMTAELDAQVLRHLAEWGATDIPVLAGADFGHIDPQWILPHGVLAELDPRADRLRLLEAAVL